MTDIDWCQSPILVYLKLLALDRFSFCFKKTKQTRAKADEIFFW